MTDAGDGVLEQIAAARRLSGLAEAERVEDRDRAGADGEHVAEDPADAGGGSLERLDGARVVVGFHLERNREAAADVDGAGVLARTHDDVWAVGREAAKQFSAVFVGAVLGPHQAEHRELDAVRLAAKAVDDLGVLAVGETELAVAGAGRHGCHVTERLHWGAVGKDAGGDAQQRCANRRGRRQAPPGKPRMTGHPWWPAPHGWSP